MIGTVLKSLDEVEFAPSETVQAILALAEYVVADQ